MSCVVDCSIVIRLLANKPGDELLRRRLARILHAPALIDAEISSVVRGLSLTAKPDVQISAERAREMHADYAGLRIVRHPLQPLQARAFEMRYNPTAYDAMYIALAESLGLPFSPTTKSSPQRQATPQTSTSTGTEALAPGLPPSPGHKVEFTPEITSSMQDRGPPPARASSAAIPHLTENFWGHRGQRIS